MGLNVFPASTGVEACARFENVTYQGFNSVIRTTTSPFYNEQSARNFANTVSTKNPVIDYEER